MLRSRSAAFAAAVCLVGVLGYIDVTTGYEINLSFFYVIPVALATWRTGWAAGLFLALVSMIGMFAVDNFVTRDMPFPSNNLIPYWNTGIRLGYFLVIVAILAALKRAHDRERRFARQDFLTGVANTQAFAEQFRIEIERASRYGHAISVACMDCDNFKAINDRFGHRTGDDVLKAVAATLRRRLRQTDVVARLGGDEFGILLPDTSAEAAAEVMEGVRAQLLDRMRENDWPVTFSIGVVTFFTPPETLEHALKLSDDLMYAVKKDGKNRVKHQVCTAQAFDGGRTGA